MPIRNFVLACTVLAATSAVAPLALAFEPQLAGAPAPMQPGSDPRFDQARGDRRWNGDLRYGEREAPRRREGGECYAKVKFGAQYAAPPLGPEYVWRQAPPPPGAPGPIWCLTVQSLPRQPVMISPERYGWVRVLCDTDATTDRIAHIQRRLYERGMYRGDIDGRYDERTALAVRRFQYERHIEDRGYLSYQTMTALEVAPPQPLYYHRPTTFDTGVIDWPGKTRF